MNAKGGWVYIVTNKYNRVLYIGVTSDLIQRVQQHRDKTFPNAYTTKYNCFKLVYYKFYESIEEAIYQEKYLKGKTRGYKDMLINIKNPDWEDLFNGLI